MTVHLNARSGLAPFLDYVEETTGMTVPETNYRVLRDAVVKRIGELDTDRKGYLEIVRSDPDERERFLNAATINETYFFRESRHFSLIRSLLLPEFARRSVNLNLWSVTCSSGEEALSLAMIAAECCPPGVEFRVFASDINTDSLRRLGEGTYSRNSLREDGKLFLPLLHKYFRHSGSSWRAGEALLSRVVPVHLNISRPLLEGIPEGIHIALFRNTLIYMKPGVKAAIIDSVAGRIAPGGYLFLSSAEMPHLDHAGLDLQETEGVYYFRKRSVPASPGPVRTAAEPAAPTAGPVPLAQGEAKRREPSLSFDGGSILGYASALSARKEPPEGPDRHNILAAELIHYALYFINSLRFVPARQVLDIIEKLFTSEITAYLRGFTEMLAGNRDLARSRFRESINRNGGFWPARFHLAKLLMEAGDASALREFSACRDGIASGGQGTGAAYLFLMEQFSEKYFMELCDRYISMLQKK